MRFTSRPNLNSSDVSGKTALIYAAAFGNKEVAGPRSGSMTWLSASERQAAVHSCPSPLQQF